MPIQMKGTAVTSEKRDSYKTMDIISFTNPFPDNGGSVGITPTFATNVTSKIEELKTNIDNKVKEIQNTQNDAAIKGEKVQAGIGTFIDGIIETANNLNAALTAAEQDIINSVETAYKTQDENLEADLNADTKVGFSTGGGNGGVQNHP